MPMQQMLLKVKKRPRRRVMVTSRVKPKTKRKMVKKKA